MSWLWGGFSVDNPTLNRFFVLHFLFPFIIVGVVALHVVAIHVTKSNNPEGIDVRGPQDVVPFHPYYTSKDAVGLLVFLLVFAFFVFYMPNYLGHPDNYTPANPLSTPAHIVPEWYFLPFYAILRSIPDKFLGVLALVGAMVVLFLLPWLDRSPIRSCRYRPVYKWLVLLFTLDVVFLGWLGSKPAEGGYVTLAQIGTFWYFLHFLVLTPLVGIFEKPRTPPASIREQVLKAV